jgi:hypothetical protein
MLVAIQPLAAAHSAAPTPCLRRLSCAAAGPPEDRDSQGHRGGERWGEYGGYSDRERYGPYDRDRYGPPPPHDRDRYGPGADWDRYERGRQPPPDWDRYGPPEDRYHGHRDGPGAW